MRALFNTALLFAGAPSLLDNFVRSICPNAATISFLGVQAREVGIPQTTISYFEQLPTKFRYLNSTTVFYFDSSTGAVYVSEDEAKSWLLVDSVPSGDAADFIEHPYDNRIAYILTRGIKHYTTRDRGRTWHSFEVPMPPIRDIDPLSFHANPEKAGYVLYQGTQCGTEADSCIKETFYTTDGFSTEPKRLLSRTVACLFAGDLDSEEHEDLIVCHHNSGSPSLGVLLASSDFFVDEIREIDFGAGSRANRGVLSFLRVNQFLTVNVVSDGGGFGPGMVVYVTTNAKQWKRAHFPSSAELKRIFFFNFMGDMSAALAIGIPSLHSWRYNGLFISDVNGTYYVESLKHIHQPNSGPLDFRSLRSPSVALANQVENVVEVENDWELEPKLRTVITYNDGASWNPLDPPPLDMHGRPWDCGHHRAQNCSLHLHLNPKAHNPPTPPGYILGVGSVSGTLLPYEECDTYLSRDAGKSWMQVRHGPHKYASGDSGNILVLVNDQQPTDHVRYSTDAGVSWQKLKLDVTIRVHLLTTAPGATSQQFMLIGTLPNTHENKRIAVVHIDFSPTQGGQCTEQDVEKWYAQGRETDCVMGQKQWFWRRKPERDCYMGTAFNERGADLGACLCTDADFGCDYNYVLQAGQCAPLQSDSIPESACLDNPNEEEYKVLSGYRLVPGNACKREEGNMKDAPVMKSCVEEKPRRGEVGHQIFKFPAPIGSYYYLGPKTILAQSWSGIWKSLDEGYSWSKIILDPESSSSILIHPYDGSRAYLLTPTDVYHYTTDAGHQWFKSKFPAKTMRYTMPRLFFHPKHQDYLIWSNDVDCNYENRENCHVGSYLSLDHGENWKLIETYVERCEFAMAMGFNSSEKGIVCASYRDKTGQQRDSEEWNPLELTISHDWYETKEKLFDHINGFENSGNLTFVAASSLDAFSLDPYVSVDGRGFVKARFPPNIGLRGDHYSGIRRIVQSTQNSTFLQIIASESWRAQWSTLLKSNVDRTFYGSSLDYVDQDMSRGLDYYLMPGLDGVALANVVTNPKEAMFTGKKKIQTRITHNDGGSWSPLNPPERDSYGASYPCDEPTCSLHLQSHNVTLYGQKPQRAPTLAGLMMGVGNVGKVRSPYRDSDMFLTRNGGLTWEGVHKGTHIWETGDSGSILVMASDEGPVNHIKYSTDDGAHWTEYNFGLQIWVKGIYTSPKGMSRKFTLLGSHSHPMDRRSEQKDVVVYLDFTELTGKQCRFNTGDRSQDDFETWDPSTELGGKCLLGAKASHYRLKRDSNCYIGDLVLPSPDIQSSCECTKADFECEYNHVRNAAGDCVLIPGAVPLLSAEVCTEDGIWYERTGYRQIAKSMCTGGTRPDRGTWHYCRGHWLQVYATLLWSIAIASALASTGAALRYYRQRNSRKGPIHLPDSDEVPNADKRDILTSIPS